jgi:hypothetical protein
VTRGWKISKKWTGKDTARSVLAKYVVLCWYLSERIDSNCRLAGLRVEIDPRTLWMWSGSASCPSVNIHWTEQCSPVNITPLHAWDTVLDQCGGSSLLMKVFAVLDDFLQANCQNSMSVSMLLILTLLSQNIHKHFQSVLNELYSSYHRWRITILKSGLVEWCTVRLCTVLQDLISGSGFATVYSVVKQNVAHIYVQNLLLCWSLKSVCIY